MSNKEMLECLKGMLGIVASRWEDEYNESQEAQYALVYAQICTAIAALNAPKPFIQIGRDIINRADIIRVAIEKRYRNVEYVSIYTREIQPGPEGEAVSYSFSRCYNLESDEARALLAWIRPQTELLASYREDSSDEDEEPPYAHSDCDACSDGQCDIH